MSKLIWRGKKNRFGLPLSVTTYTLTDDFLIIQDGILSSNENQIKLFKITDVNLHVGFFDRFVNQGTIELFTTDSHDNLIYLQNIKDPRRVRDYINKYTEESLKRNRVYQNQMFQGSGGRFPTGNTFNDGIVSDRNNDVGDGFF